MTSQTKPIYQYFKQVRYNRHKNTLNAIEKERQPLSMNNSLESMHEIRRKSHNFHHIEYQNSLTSKNQILLKKLLDISNRKASQYSKTINYPKIVTFNNPARKKREKMITEMNQQLAERMLNRQSNIDSKSMRKSMQQYDRIKKTIYNNKRINNSSLILPPANINLKSSKIKLQERKQVPIIQYEVQQGDNPQYIEK